jgi:hypothetical protein
MRLIAIQTVEGITSVMYRWADEPLIRSRMLVQTKDNLEAIYQKLKSILHNEIERDDFVIVVNEHEPPELEAVFAGFRVMRFPGVRFDDLVYVGPFAPAAIEQSLGVFLDYADDPEKARVAFAEVLHTPIHLTGFSRAAIKAVRAIPELTFEPVIAPLHALNTPDLPVIIAVESDPGLSREEMQLIENNPFCALVIIKTDDEPGTAKATLDFIFSNIEAESFRLISKPYAANLQIWHTLYRIARLRIWFRANFSDKDTTPIWDIIKSLNQTQKSE